jgi:hypothetical protein
MSRPRRAAGFQVETVDDELLLFDHEHGRILALNPTGALLWHLCDGARTVGEIVELLQQGYPEAAAAIPAEVAETLAKLSEAGALESA